MQENNYLKLLEKIEQITKSFTKYLPENSYIIARNDSEIEAYKKDPDVELNDPHLIFKYISLSQPYDFPFSFYLSQYGYMFEFALGSSYTGGVEDAEQAEKDIKTIIQLLLSGQLAILRTQHGNRVYAQEVLLFDQNNNPKVIVTDPAFPLFASKDLHTQLLRNRFRELKHVKLPKDFILDPVDENGTYPYTGRKITSLDEPLTKKNAEHIMQKVVYGSAIGEDGGNKNLYKRLFSSWQTYALCGIALAIVLSVPEDFATPVGVFLSFIIFWVILPRVIK